MREDTSYIDSCVKRQWIDKDPDAQWSYGSCWWNVPPTMTYYTEEHLSKWTDREIMKMHYYLTNRLDGYGHLSAHDSIKHNCDLFRRVLRERGRDGVDNVIWNETFYNWGYREWQFTPSLISHPVAKPETKLLRVSF